MIAHDVDHSRKAITDLFEEGLASPTHGSIMVDIHGLADVSGKNQHIG
jgi:hypothetical protein